MKRFGQRKEFAPGGDIERRLKPTAMTAADN
jgi:hypothetical protein